ncbi:FAD-dependent oxidoreductase [Myxosarcina sp. GI1]|uniref:flavin monoamine oxidase family protein n=1 Tax=Myxosarcina sp. GI1 TaxID=1541065 RepID=UPI00090792B2|nr:FAD-dependent oxidoreductase [Myxosarcina sp. GI1]
MLDCQVIVIGAGIAGLSAASYLQQQGLKVVVLEARQRLGGRIHTTIDRWSIPIDLGASWIHGTEGNPIKKLATDFKIATAVTDYDSIDIFDYKGQPFSEFKWHKYAKIWRRAVKGARKNWHEDGCLQTVIDEMLASKSLSASQIRQLNYFINTEIEHEYGADLSELSAFKWDRDREFSGDDVFFPGGYTQIIDILAAGLEIKLEHRVERVSYDSHRVTVSTDCKEFTAAKAIVTLPLGVLKKQTVTFSPPLPIAKQKAIALLGVGILNKTYLHFPHAFWSDRSDLIGYIGKRKGEWMEFVNIYKYTGVPVLLGYNAGRYGSYLETLSDDEIVASMMAVLQTIYDRQIPQPTDYQITRWESDRYACGAYSFMTPGATGKTIKDLAKPINNCLFFAGEATSLHYPATVHGAYLSGIKAARSILKSTTD